MKRTESLDDVRRVGSAKGRLLPPPSPSTSPSLKPPSDSDAELRPSGDSASAPLPPSIGYAGGLPLAWEAKATLVGSLECLAELSERESGGGTPFLSIKSDAEALCLRHFSKDQTAYAVQAGLTCFLFCKSVIIGRKRGGGDRYPLLCSSIYVVALDVGRWCSTS